MATEHFPDGRGSNIIGLLEGTDPVLSKEVIIIGAHLDHLGRCYEIIPGANDNASAVAVMMGVAKALAENKIRLKNQFCSFLSVPRTGNYRVKSLSGKPVFPLEKALCSTWMVLDRHAIYAKCRLNFLELWKFVKMQMRNISIGALGKLFLKPWPAQARCCKIP
jgi:hypothetical protein